MRKLFAAVTLALSLGTFAYAAEPAKAPAPGAPAAVAPAAVPVAPGVPAAAAPAAAPMQQAVAPAPAAPLKKEIKANKVITISMFLCIIGVTLCVVIWAARHTKSTAD